MVGLDASSLRDLHDGHSRAPAEQRRQRALVLGREVLDEDQRDLRLRAQRVEDFRERFETARRRADADDGNRGTGRLLAVLVF